MNGRTPDYRVSIRASRGEGEWRTSTSNRGAYKCVELFITADGELEVTRSYTLDTEILRSVTLENVGMCDNV